MGGRGGGEAAAREVRARSWESDLGGQGRGGPSSPRGEHLCPPARSTRVPPRRERSGRLRALGRPGSTGPLGCRGGGGLPGSAQVSAAAPPSRGKGLSLCAHRPRFENFRSACTQPGEGLATLPGFPHPDPAAARCAQVPPSGCSGLLLAGSLSLPPSLLRTPEKFGPSAGAGSPALTPRRAEPKRQDARGSRGRRRAAARAQSSSQRPLLLRPPTELEKGRRPPGCHLPALPPRRVTPRSTAPARRRQVPARGGKEEPAAIRARAPRLRPPQCPDPRSPAGHFGVRVLAFGLLCFFLSTDAIP